MLCFPSHNYAGFSINLAEATFEFPITFDEATALDECDDCFGPYQTLSAKLHSVHATYRIGTRLCDEPATFKKRPAIFITRKKEGASYDMRTLDLLAAILRDHLTMCVRHMEKSK